MERNNVCKFNPYRSSDLICLNFIKECNNAQNNRRSAEHFSIHLVLNGNGTFVCDGIEHEIEKGTLFFVCEGNEFYIESRSDQVLEYCYICFRGRRANELIFRFNIVDNNVLHGYSDMIPFWEECQALAEESNIDVVCESVILYSLAKLCPSKKESCDVVPKVIELTQKNFTDPDISVSAIADILGYNEKYLSTHFKKKKGVTYTQYLREQRIKHAIFLIEQGVESVKNIALLSGFRDALYFSKVFTASVGMPPKDYIKSIQIEE